MTKKINAIIIKQWLTSWDKVNFDTKNRRTKPEDHFYMFSIKARDLKQLSDVHRREADKPRTDDANTQRKHDGERSSEIAEYVKGGFPWSVLSDSKKKSEEFKDLMMPGWLPTAIIANIKSPGSIRNGIQLEEKDSVKIKPLDGGIAEIIYPESFTTNWAPKAKPIEIIDGQHRLLAFDELSELSDEYELPVIAFNNLDRTWQAYLFYVINIKPKKINTSLAFDLYPLLRVQSWLEGSPERAMIYREARAQELTEILWSSKSSPWYKKINMLGDVKGGSVTQAAFIRSLTSTFIKRRAGEDKIGGLFGESIDNQSIEVLPWSRTQQGAYLIYCWKSLANSVLNTQLDWTISLRNKTGKEGDDLAFSGKNSLISTDQGVRGVLNIFNDFSYMTAEKYSLFNWNDGQICEDIKIEDINNSLESLEAQPISSLINKLSKELCLFDWRSSSAEGLSEEKKRNQQLFKGSGGYKELRLQLLQLISKSSDNELATLANQIIVKLGY